MSDIVNLDERRPHYTGDAICSACGHNWTTVALVGTFWLECPKCHSNHGMPKHSLMHDENHWSCGSCDSVIFSLGQKSGWYCVQCGKKMDEPA